MGKITISTNIESDSYNVSNYLNDYFSDDAYTLGYRTATDYYNKLEKIVANVYDLTPSSPETNDVNTNACPYYTPLQTTPSVLTKPEIVEAKNITQSSRTEAKKKVHRKFKVGDLISLKIKSICGSKEVIRGFKVKKCVYTMNNQEMNVLIVKQIYGPEGRMFTLNRRDCEKLHVKFEPGLQVFSMFLNWGNFKEKQETNK